MEIPIDKTPEWIKYNSKLYDMLIENEQENIIIPNEYYITYPIIKDIEDFKRILDSDKFYNFYEYPNELIKFGYNNQEEVTSYLLPFINSDKNYDNYKKLLENILSKINEDNEEFIINLFENNLKLDYTNELIGYFSIKEFNIINFPRLYSILFNWNIGLKINNIGHIYEYDMIDITLSIILNGKIHTNEISFTIDDKDFDETIRKYKDFCDKLLNNDFNKFDYLFTKLNILTFYKNREEINIGFEGRDDDYHKYVNISQNIYVNDFNRLSLYNDLMIGYNLLKEITDEYLIVI